ncbi:MAG: ribonuclease III [Capnocytophaga sp.]|nr:ribonuclease III [Capnocytophaga sp.]
MWNLKKILNFSRLKKKDGIFYAKLKILLGFEPKNLQFYSEAFTHPSYQHHRHKRKSFERLEFLGDAVLGSVVAEHLFLNAPEEDEGYLTKMRSKIVERRNLNELGEELHLCDFLRSRLSMQQLGHNINGNLFEALIGAIYLDTGYEKCTKFIHQKLIIRYGDLKRLEGKIISHKSLLIEWCQKHKKKFSFETCEDVNDRSGMRFFVSKLIIEDYSCTKARATSKKKAEEKAAKRIYFKIQGKKIE